MTKRMGIWMAVTMSSMFLCGGLGAYFASRPDKGQAAPAIFGTLAVLSFVLLFAGTVGVTIVGLIRSAIIRRTGKLLTGAIVHARPAGYVNNVPNWEIELQLTDGRTARMQLARYGGVEPGEPLQVMVGRGNPAHAALPSRATRRRSF